MPFTHTQTIRFQHCDPAGIVFYPRYFEMINTMMEEWMASMGRPFAQMHGPDAHGVPMAGLTIDFTAPSRLGERLDFTVTPEKIGLSSARLSIVATGDGVQRFACTATIVWLNLSTMRSDPWPDDLRGGMTASMERTLQ